MGTDDKWEWWVIPFFLFAVAWHSAAGAIRGTIAALRGKR